MFNFCHACCNGNRENGKNLWRIALILLLKFEMKYVIINKMSNLYWR